MKLLIHVKQEREFKLFFIIILGIRKLDIE